MEAIPLPDASVDAVMCVYAFHEMPEDARQAAAAEFFRCVAHGGMLWLHLARSGWAWVADDVFACVHDGWTVPLQSFVNHMHMLSTLADPGWIGGLSVSPLFRLIGLHG